MAGVRTPSPMTIQAPIKAKTSNILCRTLFFSNVDLKLNPKPLLADAIPSFLYSYRSSSATWPFGKVLTRAWRQSKEYRAKVPPSPLSSARSTMKTYLRRGIRVKVQNTKDRTPNISSLDSE